MAEGAGVPSVTWDSGTAYDFFVSLNVINAPAEYGLRPSWAAGIRSRLSPSGRMVFSNAMAKMCPSIWWINNLPKPKQARNVLELLEGMKPEEILPSLCADPDCADAACGVPSRVLKKGA